MINDTSLIKNMFLTNKCPLFSINSSNITLYVKRAPVLKLKIKWRVNVLVSSNTAVPE